MMKKKNNLHSAEDAGVEHLSKPQIIAQALTEQSDLKINKDVVRDDHKWTEIGIKQQNSTRHVHTEVVLGCNKK